MLLNKILIFTNHGSKQTVQTVGKVLSFKSPASVMLSNNTSRLYKSYTTNNN